MKLLGKNEEAVDQSLLSEEGPESPICLIKINDSNTQYVILPCDTRHIFHRQCLVLWLKKNFRCPVCRTEVTEEAL